jgi:G3E family GTPase
MTDPAARIPIFVLTGFLGSGKTSLLNTLLKDPAFRDTAVIVNEFGDIGLDHLLVASAKENTVLLDAGCLCCAMIDSLKETLADLFHRRARSDLPMFQRVIIETTGLADPVPILHQLTRDPLVSHSYRLRGVLCTIDALFGEDQLSRHAEAMAQAAVADWLIVTKADLRGGPWPAARRRLLRSLNSSATIQEGARLPAGDSPSADDAFPWLNDIRQSHDEPAVGGAFAAHDDAISSESFWLDQPVTWAGLAAWTDWMRQTFGAALLRSKGLMNVAGAKGPVVLHGVRDRFELTRSASWPDQERRSRLVIIGRNLNRAQQAAGLGWLYAEAGAQPPGLFDSPPPPLPPSAMGHPHAI